MAKEQIFTGIDIGTTAVRVAVGQHNQSTGELQIIGAAEHPSEGVSKGVIVSIEDAVSSISGCLEKVERMIGMPIERATIAVNGAQITSLESTGTVAVSKADGEISEEDVDRVLESAQSVASPPNFETLHVLARTFVVDQQPGIRDPIGMTGIKLEGDVQIIQAQTAQIKNLTKCVFRTGVDIDNMVLGPLASADGCLSKRQKELGVVLINIGSSTTGVIVYEEGDVIFSKILPVGSEHITNDIAIGLRTGVDTAEMVKLDAGSANPEDIDKREEVDLRVFDENEDGVVPRRHVAEIINARVEEVFSMVNKELRSIEREGMLPAGVVITGGGAKLEGIVDVAKEQFHLPATVGKSSHVQTAIETVNDPAFSTAVGLVSYAARHIPEKGRINFQGVSSVTNATDKVRGWLKALLP